MPAKEFQPLLETLKTRFNQNKNRHPGVSWEQIEKKLEKNEKALSALSKMEETGGEPDVVVHPAFGDGFAFVDCAPESPSGRRSVCYDAQALEKRKENKPWHSALGLAAEWGVTVLSEEQYRVLQSLGEFDQKTSSWVLAPDAVRNQGGGFFMNRHYGLVFLYYNGAESYYAARGFRAFLTV